MRYRERKRDDQHAVGIFKRQFQDDYGSQGLILGVGFCM